MLLVSLQDLPNLFLIQPVLAEHANYVKIV